VNAIVFGCRWNNGNTCIAPRRIFVTETLADELEQRLRERAVARFHLSITRVGSDDEALHLAATSRFALGASVFGEQLLAQAFAARVHAGIVTVNDIIAPTADPRVPFGGRGWSGFGTTRGAEGLLEFTSPKAIVTQTARRLRHIEPLPNNAGEIFAAYLAAIHQASWTGRLSGWRRFLSALLHGNHMTDQRDL
jgi:acyl-CoA reductase-like NAD-dependent aldehyde dehydrogenase